MCDTGHFLRVPVGDQTLGRALNVLGEPLDGKPLLNDGEVEWRPVQHQPMPLSSYTTSRACQRALAHSLARENQSRLLTMQSAEKNLGEMAAGLQNNLQGRRQNAVTEELLDVISGFEMLKDQPSGSGQIANE